MPDARYDHSMVENDDDGKAYIFGGADASGVGLNDIWAFNKDLPLSWEVNFSLSTLINCRD